MARTDHSSKKQKKKEAKRKLRQAQSAPKEEKGNVRRPASLGKKESAQE